MQVRIARWEDLAEIYAIYCPYIQNTTVSFEIETPSFAQFQQRFAHVTADYPWLVVVDDETIIAYAYASRAFARAAYDWCCDLAIYFRMGIAHQGMAAVLYEALMELLRRQNVRIAYALVTGENERSVRFHDRMAFRRAGCLHACGYKFGKWHDVLWLEKELYEEREPKPFVPWSVLDEREKTEVLANANAKRKGAK